LENIIINEKETVIDPVGITIDSENRKVYWTNQTQGNIYEADLNGENTEILVSGLSRPDGIVVADGKIFWTEVGIGVMKSSNLKGEDIKRIAEFLDYPLDITVDRESNQVYWINLASGNSTIERMDYDGLNRQMIISDYGPIAALTIDKGNQKLYWATLGNTYTLYESNLDGSEVSPIKEGVNSINDLVVQNNSQVTSTADLVIGTLTVFPNPVASQVTVTIDQLNSELLNLSVVDVSGKNIKQMDSVSGLSEYTVNLNDLPNGIYWIELHTAIGKIAKKIIKEK